uniref:Uncharacterized protein n=1 Tax=Triticum urartu TaxID=4572 RepID=A0A8R7QBW1_TRIUA
HERRWQRICEKHWKAGGGTEQIGGGKLRKQHEAERIRAATRRGRRRDDSPPRHNRNSRPSSPRLRRRLLHQGHGQGPVCSFEDKKVKGALTYLALPSFHRQWR